MVSGCKWSAGVNESSVTMKASLPLGVLAMLFANVCVADIGHDSDAKKVEVEVFSHSFEPGSDEWSVLNGEIYNPFSLPITLRDVRSSAGDTKIERSVTVLGNKVWTELKLLQISGGEVLLLDGSKYRMQTNTPLVNGELLQIGLNFGPIGWKSYFYQIKDQTKP
jgi:hypothetical protein